MKIPAAEPLTSLPPVDDEANEPSLELKGLLHLLLRRLWVVVIIALASGLAASAYVQRIPRLYRSVTVIEIESQERKALQVSDGGEQNLKDPTTIETIVQDFRNRSLMQRVANALKLGTDEAFLGRPVNAPAPREYVVGLLLQGTSAAIRPKTRLVDVAFTHRDPVLAQKIADALVEQFLQQGVEQRMNALGVQNGVLVQKSEELRVKLERSERALQEYKKQMESVSLDDRRNLVEEKLRALNTDLSAAKAERLRLEGDLEPLRKAGDRPNQLLTVASVAQDPQVVMARERVTALEAESVAILQRYREKHPRVLEIKAQLDNARAALNQAIRGSPQRMEAVYRAATAKEEGLQRAVAEQEKAMLELDEKLIPFRALQREYESDRTLFQSVLQRLKESSLAVGIQPVTFHVVEPAIPAYRVADTRLLVVIAGVFGGALAAVGVLAALFFLDSSIKTVDEAERLLGLPVLAAVPKMPKPTTPGALLALVEKADSAVAESFRSLRSGISLLGHSGERRVFLFTSALAGEGKSVVAANTAVAFAQQGLRTLLIEADLRRPTQCEIFGIDPKRPGVAEYMVGTEVMTLSTTVPGLSILPAGAHAPNPAELLTLSAFCELVESLQEDFERIVIDTAPVNVVSDTLNIVSCAPTVCLVIRTHSTSRKVVRRAVELLRRARVQPDGVVLNMAPDWNGLGYHYYYSSSAKYGTEQTYGTNYRNEFPLHVASPQVTGKNGLAEAEDSVSAEKSPAVSTR